MVTTINNDLQDLMDLCAFRYCLGRRTYVVSSFVEYIFSKWEEVPENSKNIFLREINEASENDGLGMDCDIQQWMDLKQRIEEEFINEEPITN